MHWRSRYLKIFFIETCLLLACYPILVWSNRFDDFVFSKADDHEYHLIAVDWLHGNDFFLINGKLPLASYKFDSEFPQAFIDGLRKSPFYDFYRTPGYPFFLSVIYKIFGISPLTVKHVQLIILYCISLGLPFLGSFYWGRKGFLAGLIAAPIYLVCTVNYAARITTEPLISLWILLFIIVFNVYNKHRQIVWAQALGIVMGCGMLIKGSLTIIPLFTVVYLSRISQYPRFRQKLCHVLIIVLCCAAPVLIWSSYASMKAGTFILPSTQGPIVLFYGNNEYCVDGGYHPEEPNALKTAYHAERHEKSLLRVAAEFYLSRPGLFFKSFICKLPNAFSRSPFFWITLLLGALEIYGSFFARYFKLRIIIGFLCIISLCLAWGSGLACHIHSYNENMFNKIGTTFYPLYTMLYNLRYYSFAAGMLVIIPLFFLKSPPVTGLRQIPPAFLIVFMNFCVLSILLFGDNRFVMVMKSIETLTGVWYILFFIEKYFKAGPTSYRDKKQRRLVSPKCKKSSDDVSILGDN